MEAKNNEQELFINNLLPFMTKDYLSLIYKKFNEIKDILILKDLYGLPSTKNF